MAEEAAEGFWRAYVFLPSGEEFEGPIRLSHEDAQDDLLKLRDAGPEYADAVAFRNAFVAWARDGEFAEVVAFARRSREIRNSKRSLIT